MEDKRGVSKEVAVEQPKNPGRRSFLGKVGGTAVAAAAGSTILKPLLGGKNATADASTIGYIPQLRSGESFFYRMNSARADNVHVGLLPDNGDLAEFPDFSGLYSKSLLHDALGLPNAKSWSSMRRALTTGSHSAFQAIHMGTPGGGPNSRLNGPQGALAFDLEGLDSHATVIPPSPSVASAQTAAEQVEHYWASLLADVPFSQYTSNPLVAQAVADMNHLSFLNNQANNQFPFPV